MMYHRYWWQLMQQEPTISAPCIRILYKNDAEKGYLYLGVQISEPRLMAFIGGQLDLRDAYVHPEVENALYVVTAKKEVLTATTILQPQDLTEDMLPEAGYKTKGREKY